MKSKQLLFSLLTTTFLLCSTLVLAQSKEKRVEKSFNVNSSTAVHIDNKFGKVHVNTWSQNKVELKVLITAESGSNSQEILDRIDIDINESSSALRFETEIENTRQKWRNQRFKIDYTVSMPASNSLEINHRHGDVFVDKRSGSVNIDLAHGQIVTEELTGRCDITIRHGSGGRIASIGSGSLDMQHYQRLRIGNMGNIELEVAHAQLDVEKAGDLDFDLRHASFEVESAGNVEVNLQHSKFDGGDVRSFSSDMQHSNVSIDRLQSRLSIDSNHGNVEVDRISKGFQSVNFDGNHSYLGISLEPGASASIDAEMSFGKMNYLESEVKMSYVNKEDHRSEYKGTTGSNPTAQIRFKGNFSDFTLDFD
jgi:hypothetical protein